MTDQYGYSNRTTSRVYINPNYNRSVVENIPALSNTMYLNPNFCHTSKPLYTNHQKDGGKPKIHLNPNFIRNNSYQQSVVHNPQTVITQCPSYNKADPHLKCTVQKAVSNVQAPLTQFAKSKYCFVRQKENGLVDKPEVKKQTNTVSINKYKLVSLNDVKLKLATAKPAKNINSTPIKQLVIKNIKHLSNPGSNTRFKFIKNNMNINQSHSKFNSGRIQYTNRSISKTPIKKVLKSALKKNNIPCPLFKKYGNCLRRSHGTCDYLHDKKHVSICRKFLKGICHDNQCLLSHELTDKKMPTCYFYLQGVCTKENCPYLHVKLNEKAKVCQDFIKGYCEKGDKCLHRHISGINKNSKFKTRDTKEALVKMKSKRTSANYKKQKSESNNPTPRESESVKEQRYFKEQDGNISEQYNLIKPSRCKLGTLPSFIQL